MLAKQIRIVTAIQYQFAKIMKSRHCLLLVPILLMGTIFAVAEYDPLQSDYDVSSKDFRITKGDSDRELPIRCFYPTAPGRFPVVLYSHGLGGSIETANFLGEHWASRGYVALHLQHPGSDDSIWTGKSRLAAIRAFKEAANAENAILRIEDVSFVLDKLVTWTGEPDHWLGSIVDLNKVGMSGHSFGAKTTQSIGGELAGSVFRPINRLDSRVSACIPMSPSPSNRNDPAFSFGSVTIPWLLMTGTEDGAPSGIVDTTPEDRRKVYPALPAGSKYELVLWRAEHSAFTERTPRGGDPKNPNHHRVILAASTAFWDAYLRNDIAANQWLLSGILEILEPEDEWQFK
jgi:dienelactone hydrolase